MIKNKKRFIIPMLILAISFQACYYDKADLVYPLNDVPCDTSIVSYATDITTILNANCYSCHSGSAVAGSGIKLDVYSSASAYALTGPMLQVIMHNPGFSAMPKNGTKLSACNIAKIRTWIRNGAPNN